MSHKYHQYTLIIKLLMQKLIIGGISAAAVSIGILFAFNKKNEQKIIPRDIVLEVVKKIRQDMYVVLFDIASYVQENTGKAPPDQMRSLILSEESPFQKKMKTKLKSIFADYEIDENTFQNQIQKIYKNDAEIQYHVKQYQQQTEKAILGMQPQFKEDCITFMGSDKVLLAIDDILEHKIERISKKLEQVTNSGEEVVPSSLLKSILRSDDEKEGKNYRLKVLRKMGLISDDRQAVRIFQFCIAKYMRFANNFKSQYEKKMDNYHKRMEILLSKYCKLNEL